MRLQLILSLFCFIHLMTYDCYANDSEDVSLQEIIYSSLCGAWDYGANINSQVDYSWESNEKDHNHSVIIDLDDEQPYIQIEGIGNLSINSMVFHEPDDTIYLSALLERADRDFVFIIHLNNDGSIWFEKIGFLFGYGPEKPYRKTVGPVYNEDDLKHFSQNIREISHIARIGILNDSNVRIRRRPSLHGEYLGLLRVDEKVVILDQTDTKMTIGDLESSWYQLVTVSGLVGWSYGAYIDFHR